MRWLLFFILTALVSCLKDSSAVVDEKIDLGMFQKQGHRGCRGLMPENTIPAMFKAIDLGMTNLEIDVAITKDNKVIVSHDPYFSAVFSTKPNGQPVTQPEEASLKFFNLPFSMVEQFDVGLRKNNAFPDQQTLPAKVPLLDVLIDSVEAYTQRKGLPAIRFNIEIKSSPLTDGLFYPPVPQYVELVMDIVKARNLSNRVSIISFDVRPLQYMQRLYPTVKTTYITQNFGNIDFELGLLGFVPDCVSPLYAGLNIEGIQKLQKQKIRVIPWTVNDKAAIENLKKMGVNGIITDYPNLLN